MHGMIGAAGRAAALGMVWGLAAAAAAPAGAPVVGRQLASVTGDLDGDGTPDRAALIATGEVVDLAIWLSAGGRLPDRPTVVKHALGWQGELAGTEPEISISPRGALVVVFKDDAVPRARWHQQLTIAFHGGGFVVAGYGYDLRDSRQPENSGSCELDLMTGEGRRNRRPVTFPAGAVPLAQWSDRDFPKLCAF